jgi:hypothetical protein
VDGISAGTAPPDEGRALIAAVCYNGKSAPAWAEEKAIADEAHIKPWEVEDMPAVWYYRIRKIIEAQNEAAKPKAK